MHVLSSFGMGGQERVALDLSREQKRCGYEVSVVALSDAPGEPMAAFFEAAGVRTARLARRGPSYDPTLTLRLSQAFLGAGVEIVHTHNPHALVYGGPAAALAGAACVHTKHGINPDAARRLWMRRAAAKLIDAYVAVTPSLARVAVNHHECDPSRLHVIENGIDIHRFQLDLEARHRVRAELGIPEQAWVVGTVGRLAPEKNQALLIDAMAPMLDPRRHLVIVGDGPERAALEERAAATLRPELVHFAGARDKVEEMLSAFDLFALTSSSEGLPLVLLEAMAEGLPVISTRVGGVPDLVEDGRTGFLVPQGDAIALTRQLAWLSGRPESVLAVAGNARRLVLERHSTEHMAAQYSSLYDRVRRGHRSDLLQVANG
jgi:glycosyltransferase involved in cell wall biosynthesis